MIPRLTHARLAAPALCLLAAAACGDDPEPPPPPPPVTTAVIDAADPCAEDVISPSDLFYDADGQPETLDCPLPSDPIQAAIAAARRFDGAAIDAQINVPLDGSLDARTLGSTVTFSLTGGSTTAGQALPVSVVLELTGTATDAASWAVVDHSITFNNGALRLRTDDDLRANTFHVVVVTRAPKDSDGNPLGQSATVKALVSDAAIEVGSLEGVEAPAAGRLERMRLALQPVLPILAGANPPIAAEDIVSIHGFSTEKGAAHLTDVIEDYTSAIDRGRFGFSQDNRVVPLNEVYIGLPAAAYEGVAEFRVGTITAPRLLDDDGHLRPNWTEQVETIEIPFSLSIPAGSDRYGVAVFVPGFGRGKIDGRALAPKMGMSAGSAVLTIDLRCHGDRAPEAGLCGENRSVQEVAALADDAPNNGNPEFNGADGIPDASGQGFFPGDPRALRDSQIAAVVEIMHVLRTIRAGNAAFTAPINFNVGRLHVVAQGHSAPAALAAVANIDVPTTVGMTLQLPAGGAGYRDLILDGPEDLRASFLASTPNGIDAGNVSEYLGELERTILAPLDPAGFGEEVRSRLRLPGSAVRVLLNHGRVPEYVSEDARDTLVDALSLQANRRSQHNGACDDFFIYTCTLGDNPAWLEEARGQFATFVSSGGVTVSPPAQ